MLWPGVLGWEPPCEWAVTHGRGFPGHNYARIRLASPGLVGLGQPFLPEKSHVISLGQFSICRENGLFAFEGVGVLGGVRRVVAG